jgi:hypothetical protein
MLDTFKILSTSGVVLWSRSYAPISPVAINNFISDVFIEEKTVGAAAKGSQFAATNTPYQSDQHTMKWAIVKELGIIFVVRGYPPGAATPNSGIWLCRMKPGRLMLTTGHLTGCVPVSPPPLLG